MKIMGIMKLKFKNKGGAGLNPAVKSYLNTVNNNKYCRRVNNENKQR